MVREIPRLGDVRESVSWIGSLGNGPWIFGSAALLAANNSVLCARLCRTVPAMMPDAPAVATENIRRLVMFLFADKVDLL